ncbi:MAG: DNA primase [Candidatus Nanopelagicales bacterium]
MQGRIRNDDVALVRDSARIDQVVSEYLSIKSAGGGSLKGLCPFHDEKTPSFHVTPSRGLWYCFGCGEGGDVIAFLQKVDNLSFVEAVEKLANKFNIELRFEQGSSNISDNRNQKNKIFEINRLTKEFYQKFLSNPEAEIGRNFLKSRGFDKNSADKFSIGFAPNSWDSLTKNLSAQGFNEDELILAGVAISGQKGVYDRFRNRLIWPIHDTNGQVVGFGARKMTDEDQGPKYLNTPETLVYKKSQVLYGINLAKKKIAQEKTAIVVEGYTDVMAFHEAGIENAVATCGTAFGEDHARILKRLISEDDQVSGKVIYTFDGDAAGQKAAMRAFDLESIFSSQSYIAVAPQGMDPCDLRLNKGNESLKILIDSSIPLFEFVIKTFVKDFDLTNAEGRINALSKITPVLQSIKNKLLQKEYLKLSANWLGLDLETIEESLANKQVKKLLDVKQPVDTPTVERKIQREVLKVVFQYPLLSKSWLGQLNQDYFSYPPYREVYEKIVEFEIDNNLAARIVSEIENETIKKGVSSLAVEPFNFEVDQNYVDSVFSRLLEFGATVQIEELKSRLQREQDQLTASEQSEIFKELMNLEEYRRALRDHAIGSP